MVYFDVPSQRLLVEADDAEGVVGAVGPAAVGVDVAWGPNLAWPWAVEQTAAGPFAKRIEAFVAGLGAFGHNPLELVAPVVGDDVERAAAAAVAASYEIAVASEDCLETGRKPGGPCFES